MKMTEIGWLLPTRPRPPQGPCLRGEGSLGAGIPTTKPKPSWLSPTPWFARMGPSVQMVPQEEGLEE